MDTVWSFLPLKAFRKYWESIGERVQRVRQGLESGDENPVISFIERSGRTLYIDTRIPLKPYFELIYEPTPVSSILALPGEVRSHEFTSCDPKTDYCFTCSTIYSCEDSTLTEETLFRHKKIKYECVYQWACDYQRNMYKKAYALHDHLSRTHMGIDVHRAFYSSEASSKLVNKLLESIEECMINLIGIIHRVEQAARTKNPYILAVYTSRLQAIVSIHFFFLFYFVLLPCNESFIFVNFFFLKN